MANPKITLSVDQSIIDALENVTATLDKATAALNRIADSMCATTPYVPNKISPEVITEANTATNAVEPAPQQIVTASQVQATPNVEQTSVPFTAPVNAPEIPIANTPAQQIYAPVTASPQPVAPQSVMPATMPVSTQGGEITKEQLMMAGVSLMDKGVNANTVLWEFGVQSVDQLKAEQYAAFAARLRQLGANI